MIRCRMPDCDKFGGDGDLPCGICAWCWMAKALLAPSIASLRREELAKAAETFSVFLSMIEAHRECSDDDPFEDKDVVLHFMGSGASHFVTIGDFRRLREVLREIPRETGDAG